MDRDLSRFRTSSVVLLVLIVGMGIAVAPAKAGDSHGNSAEFRIDFNSWIWMFGITGDIGRGPVKADVDASFLDVVDASDSLMAFSGRLEVGYGRFAGFIDGTYADVGAEDQSGPLGVGDIDLTTQIAVVDFGLMYRVTEWDCANSERDGTLDVYAGGRYFMLGIELDPSIGATVSRDRDIVDPIFGVKVRQPLTKKLHLNVWGDVGGFGVESDLTWSATCVFGYDFQLFCLPATVYGGYRAIGWDYSDGSGNNRVVWDAILHGPTLGMQIKF